MAQAHSLHTESRGRKFLPGEEVAAQSKIGHSKEICGTQDDTEGKVLARGTPDQWLLKSLLTGGFAPHGDRGQVGA